MAAAAFVPAAALPSRPIRRPTRCPTRAAPTATARARRPENAPGPLFVDAACIDCDACRWLAPALFTRAAGRSAVAAQPATPADAAAARAAAAACPTSSIHGAPRAPAGAPLPFPLRMDGGGGRAWYMGYANVESIAASAWLIVTRGAAVMVDVPRFSEGLARAVDAVLAAEGGGRLEYIVLTHRDDVAGHAAWAARYPGARRVIHADEVRAAQGTDACEVVLGEGGEADGWRFAVAEGVEVFHVPGHTAGSLAVLDAVGGSLFTGDSLALNGDDGRLSGFPRYCHGDWAQQMESVGRLADEPFLHMFPGHGRLVSFESADHRRAAIRDAVASWRE